MYGIVSNPWRYESNGDDDINIELYQQDDKILNFKSFF